MIGQNKKRLEITLANDEYTLLESLSSRFNISKSNVIKQALKVFASKRKHGYTTWIQEVTTKSTNKQTEETEETEENRSWDELMDEIEETKK